MAINKVAYLDEAGVQKLSTEILKCANSRIRERILTTINSAAYSDDTRVLSAAAILGVTGASDDAASASGTLYARIAALVAAIGTSSDTASDATVYGAIAAAIGHADSLTHLHYVPITVPMDDIDTVVTEPDETALYLQRDSASDTTWNLVIWDPQVEDPDDPETTGRWIVVGETGATLEGYWGKNEADTNLLISTILGAITDTVIANKVAAAFAATDPYGSGTDPYAPTGGPTGGPTGE